MKRVTVVLPLIFLLTIGYLQTALGQVRLPRIFSDNMVLQRSKPINVWGWAAPKEKVTIKFHDQTKSATADKDGKWKVALSLEQAGGPFELTVKGKSSSLTFRNVLVGEVWICSGQSNMEWPLFSTIDAETEIAAANFPNIRHIKVPNTVASQPKDDIRSGKWEECTPATAARFTAVGYYFAKKVQSELNVPVGLINTSWGGTHSETWTSREAFEGSDEFKSMIATMPKLDLEKLSKEMQEQTIAKIKTFQSTYPPSATEVGTWKSQELNDDSWRKMPVPGLWESTVEGLDGIVWLRKSFELRSEDAGKTASLSLAMIDDSDETYVNGVKVGAIEAKYNEKRLYTIPSGILKPGKNTIAVRVTDTGGGGGIYGEASDVWINIANRNESLAGDWKFQIESVNGRNGVGPNDYPTLLYNSMIAPLIPYSIAGALWYQGESNAGRAYQYRTAFPLMINDWRNHWGQGEFPFFFVQLSSWNADNGNSEKGSTWAELREAQTYTVNAVRNTSMAVTIDIGNADDIHPRNKKDVGLRLAAIALSDTYKKPVVSRGPMFNSMVVKGDRVTAEFSHADGGLVVKDKYGYVRGFEVAGSDGKFYPASASADGTHINLANKSVPNPAYIRYGWADDAGECNVFNQEGFPMEPFRSDKLKGITEGAKFWN